MKSDKLESNNGMNVLVTVVEVFDPGTQDLHILVCVMKGTWIVHSSSVCI